MACRNFLESSAKVTYTRKGSSTTPKICNQHGSKPGTKPKLSLIERLFLVMDCLRLGLGEGDLAQHFKVSQFIVSRTIIRNSVNLNITNFNHYLFGISRRKITKMMPPCFRKWHPSTQIIIDCTKLFINTPSSLAGQSSTWSAYGITTLSRFQSKYHHMHT